MSWVGLVHMKCYWGSACALPAAYDDATIRCFIILWASQPTQRKFDNALCKLQFITRSFSMRQAHGMAFKMKLIIDHDCSQPALSRSVQGDSQDLNRCNIQFFQQGLNNFQIFMTMWDSIIIRATGVTENPRSNCCDWSWQLSSRWWSMTAKWKLRWNHYLAAAIYFEFWREMTDTAHCGD